MSGDGYMDDNRSADRSAGAASLDELVGAYVLDALDPSELAEFEAFLLDADDTRAEVAFLRPVVQLLPLALAETEEDIVMAPSSDLRSRILQAARDDDAVASASEPLAEGPAPLPSARLAPAPTPPPARKTGQSGGVLVFVRRVGFERIAAGFLALVAAGAIIWGVTLQSRLSDTENDLDSVRDELALVRGDGDGVVQAVVYALEPSPDGPQTANAIVSLLAEDSTDATISTTGLPPTEAGRAYQLWFIDLDDAGNVAGARPSITFQTAGDGFASIFGVPVDGPFDAVAISEEPEGGSTTPSAVLMFGTLGSAAG